MTKIIAISGYKQSGKDLAASVMIDYFGFQRYAFADRLKDSVAKEFGILRNMLDDQYYKERALLDYPVNPTDDFSLNICRFMKNEFVTKDSTRVGSLPISEYLEPWRVEPLYWTPRALLILKGSVCRAVDPNYWVGRTLDDIGESHRNIVITDLRYKSEVVKLKEAFAQNCIIVRINRFDTSLSRDPSEIDLDNYPGFDYIIDNKGSKEDFTNKIKQVTKEILSVRI